MIRFVSAVVVGTALAISTTAHADSPALREQADSPGIVWWALGDSYSAGEGLQYNDFGANPPDSNCERATGNSTNGKPSRANSVVAKDLLGDDQSVVVDEFRLVACTGAVTNQWRGQWAETGQRRADLVTMSFGGNNVGFADVVLGCAGVSVEGGISLAIGGVVWALNPGLGCTASEQELRRRVDMLVGNGPDPNSAFNNSQTLPDMYAEIAANAVTPGGHVVVLGYPNLVEEPQRWTWRLAAGNRCHRIRRSDAAMLRGVVGYLNEQIGAAVEKANDNEFGVTFDFLDVSKVYENGASRHGLCTGQPWLNGLTVGVTGPDDGLVPIRLYRSFHPTQLGQDAMGAALAEIVRDFDWVAAPAESKDLDRAAFVGSWSGSITGPKGSRFEATVDLNLDDETLSGTISHPDLPCTGVTNEIDVIGDVVLFSTEWTDDSACVSGGAHRLSVTSSDELLYEWLAPNSTRVDSGILRRVAGPTLVAAPPGSIRITGLPAGARSVYSDEYVAEVVSVTTREPFLIDVGFVARGGSDLRRPEATCLTNEDGEIATPIATGLTTDEPGDYRGTLTFPLIQAGQWSLVYSCQSDYSAAPVADVAATGIGVSRYSSEYYAVVLDWESLEVSTIEVRFAAHGNEASAEDLRDPSTSCLLADGRSIPVSSATYLTEVSGQYYVGVLRFDFVPTTDLSFLYSCQSDYTEIDL